MLPKTMPNKKSNKKSDPRGLLDLRGLRCQTSSRALSHRSPRPPASTAFHAESVSDTPDAHVVPKMHRTIRIRTKAIEFPNKAKSQNIEFLRNSRLAICVHAFRKHEILSFFAPIEISECTGSLGSRTSNPKITKRVQQLPSLKF